MRFGILKKFVCAFLVLSLIPLIGLSFHTWYRMNLAGRGVVESTRTALVENATSLLEARARSIAGQVELFLQSAADDVRLLSVLPATEQVFLKFAVAHRREVWLREGVGVKPTEKRIGLPIYCEVTFAGAGGIERIRIEGGKALPAGRDVAKTFESAYGPEEYFEKAAALAPGKIHVTRLIGRHIHKDEQLRGAENVEDAIGTAQYRGIVRFAKAVYDQGVFKGVVSLALDHRHLMSYTQHVLPFGSGEVVFPRYGSGNYAFMFDDEGWMITHPKLWDIRGHDRRTGRLADPSGRGYDAEGLRSGTLPFNLLHVPFIHTNYRYIAREVLAGRSGVAKTSSVGGVSRVLAFAPIRFDAGEYVKTGFFGGVTLGAQTDLFHRAADDTAGNIDTALRRIVNIFITIILFAGIFVAVIAFFLARSFTRPITLLTEKAKEIGLGNYDAEISIRSGDELAILGDSFNEMGRRLKENEGRLRKSLAELKESRDAVRTYNIRLRNHVEILKSIHSGSDLMTSAMGRENVFEVILKTCVKGIGFERAHLYIPQEDGKTLGCVMAWGFMPAKERIVRRLRFRVETDRALPALVFRTGIPSLVEDVETDITLTDSDLELARRIGTRSTALAPIRIGDRIIGVLAADHVACEDPVSREQMEFLKIVANEAAMAIERSRLVNETVRRRDLIESIFANMTSGLLVFDDCQRVLSANPRALAFFGLSVEEAEGVSAERILSAYPDLLALAKRSSEGSERGTRRMEMAQAGGRHIHMETAVSPLKGAPEAAGKSTLLIFRDVTRRVNLERHLSRSDRLVSLGILAAGVAHEIRNPLTGITLLLDDLHDRMANRVDERLMMQRALEEIEKLEGIVNGLLEFAANPATRPVRGDINRVISDSLFFVRKQCRRQGVDLILNRAADLPPVFIDPERIKQALLNIVLNALNVLKAPGGQIRITTKLVEKPFVMPEGSAVEVAVLDNGPGISPEDIDFIFDPFFSHNPDGSGLGLSITHTIIEEQNGKIVVVSEPGHGACFKIYLPVEP